MTSAPHPEPIRAVLDLNILISANIVPYGDAFGVWLAWLADRFVLLISQGMIGELRDKLLEPRLAARYRLYPEGVWQLNRLLGTQGIVVEVPAEQIVAVTGDPEDDLVLATARLGQARYLVTRDKRLLGLDSYEGVTIVHPSDFLRVLGRSSQ